MTPPVVFVPWVAGSVGKVVATLGDTPAVTEASGGWAVVNRPKDVGFTVWEGYAPRSMTLVVMLDGWAANRSQDVDYDRLHRMMRDKVGPSKQPTPVRVYGPIPLRSLLWVIQSIEPDPGSMLYGSFGDLLRVKLTITLLEYVEADVLVSASTMSPAERVNSLGTASTSSGRTHTVKRGDTLWGIAQKYLGAGKRYPEIVKLNGIRDPNRVAIGTVLKLP